MSIIIDESRVEAFVLRVIDEIGAAMNVPLSVIGFRLGLYKAMGDGEPVTPAELAERTGTHERYVREWLAGQAAGGYVEYDPETETLPPAGRARRRAGRREQPRVPGRHVPVGERGDPRPGPRRRALRDR